MAAAPSFNPKEMRKMETDIEELAEEYRSLQTSRQQLEDAILRSATHPLFFFNCNEHPEIFGLFRRSVIHSNYRTVLSDVR